MSERYQPTHPIRVVTAASLFDGHDAAINVMRRILQSGGAEVIHLGHNRSAEDVVTAAIHEDAQAIAVDERFKAERQGCGSIRGMILLRPVRRSMRRILFM